MDQASSGPPWGSIFLILLAIGVIVWFVRRRKRQRNKPQPLTLAEKAGRILMDDNGGGLTADNVAAKLGISERDADRLLRELCRDHGAGDGQTEYFAYDVVNRLYSFQVSGAESQPIAAELADRAIDLLTAAGSIAVGHAATILGISEDEATAVYEALAQNDPHVRRHYDSGVVIYSVQGV